MNHFLHCRITVETKDLSFSTVCRELLSPQTPRPTPEKPRGQKKHTYNSQDSATSPSPCSTVTRCCDCRKNAGEATELTVRPAPLHTQYPTLACDANHHTQPPPPPPHAPGTASENNLLPACVCVCQMMSSVELKPAEVHITPPRPVPGPALLLWL